VNQYRIELARTEDIALLPAIERAAATLFPDSLLPPEARNSVVPLDELTEAQAQQRLWVALSPSGEPVGFAIVASGINTAFLAEIDVHPDHQKQGLGRRLVEAAIGWAETQGYSRLTLTTFNDLPWNAPFYERLGFCRIKPDKLTDDLARKLDEENRSGLQSRVAMELIFNSGDGST